MISREAFGSPAWHQMVALRHDVLRAPLGLAFGPDELAAEAGQIHLALWQDGRLAGTLLLIAPDAQDEATLRQMAIRPDLAGRGLGRRLVLHAERQLLSAGLRRVRLAARQTAIGFYARLGYDVEGAPFVEKTLPHRTMRKALAE